MKRIWTIHAPERSIIFSYSCNFVFTTIVTGFARIFVVFLLSNVGLVHTVLVRISILTQPQSSTHHGMMSHVIQVLNIDDLDSAAVLLLRVCSDSRILPSGTI